MATSGLAGLAVWTFFFTPLPELIIGQLRAEVGEIFRSATDDRTLSTLSAEDQDRFRQSWRALSQRFSPHFQRAVVPASPKEATEQQVMLFINQQMLVVRIMKDMEIALVAGCKSLAK